MNVDPTSDRSTGIKNRLACSILALMVAAATVSPAQGTAMVLVDAGKARTTIVVPAEPSTTDETAAGDLRHYIKQMTGAALPIVAGAIPEQGGVILVGPGEAARQLVGEWLTDEQVGDDGFVLKRFDRTDEPARPEILVAVGRGEGTRYAVFALLQQFGCRFFHPWQDGEHIPRVTTLTIGPLDQVSKPDIAGRCLWGSPYDKLTKEQSKKWRRWLAQHGVNGVSMQMGHNYDGFCPRSLYDEHPEYFSLVYPGSKAYEMHASEQAKQAGKPDRIKYTRCLSNPQVLQRAIDAARKHFARGAGSYSLSPDDVSRYQWCQCEPCGAMDGPGGKVSARILRFNNKVAEALADEYGDRMLPFYAEYGIPGGPPIRKNGTVMVKAHPMVIPWWSIRTAGSMISGPSAATRSVRSWMPGNACPIESPSVITACGRATPRRARGRPDRSYASTATAGR